MEEAEQVVGRVVERFPEDPYALDCTAKAQLYLGRTSEASASWERCLRLDPQAAYAYEGLGRAATMKGDYPAAIAHFRKALEVGPASSGAEWRSETTYQLADTLTKLGEVEEAAVVLDESTRADSGSARSHLLRGQLHLQGGEYEKAKASFERAIRIEPALRQAHFGLATALERTGEHDQIARSMERFKELSAKKWKARAAMLFKDEEPKELARKVAMTRTHAGQIHESHGDLAEAEVHWRRAAILSPENTTCRVFLARLYAKTDRSAQASRRTRS